MSDPVLISIAAALASRAAGTVYDVVRKKFASKREATAVLEAAADASSDSSEVQALTEELARAESSDPEFSAELRAIWREVSVEQHAERGGVVNQISGNVSGTVVQARDIQGGVTF